MARGGRPYDGHQAKCRLVRDVRRIDSWAWYAAAMARDGVRLVSMRSQQVWTVMRMWVCVYLRRWMSHDQEDSHVNIHRERLHGHSRTAAAAKKAKRESARIK